MSAAIEAISGLTSATETANALAKSASGVTETIGKSLATLVNSFFQPLGPLLIWVLQELVKAWIAFKVWWDGLAAWIDEKIFKPIREWIDTYIVKPFWDFVNKILKWIDDYIVKPFWNAVNSILEWIERIKQAFWLTVKDWEQWIDEHITKPFWAFVSNVEKWVDTYIVKPFWNWFSGVPKWIEENISKPFWKVVTDVSTWIDVHISKPFWKAISDISTWIDDHLTKPFWNFVNGAEKAFNNLVAGIVHIVLSIPYVGDALKKLGMSEIPIQSYATGGTVPGSGAQLAIVHGGEKITPAGQGNVTLNFYGYQDDKFIQKVKDVLRTEGTRYNL